NNILKPQDGRPVVSPTQDMVIGTYYLTLEKEGAKGEGKAFVDASEVIMAYREGEVALQARVKMRSTREIDGKMVNRLIDVTPGRVIFNESIPQDLGFKNRSDEKEMFDLEINTVVDKDTLSNIVDSCYRRYGA